MKTLYFDCFAGASGDMILGAMVGAGVDPEALREQLSLLNVEGFKIDFETVNRSGLSATYARVETVHEHKHRHLSDIRSIIEDSGVSQRRERPFAANLHATRRGRSSRTQRADRESSFPRGWRARRDRRRCRRCDLFRFIEDRSLRFFAAARRQRHGRDGARTLSGATAGCGRVAARRAVLLGRHQRRTADAHRRGDHHHGLQRFWTNTADQNRSHRLWRGHARV